VFALKLIPNSAAFAKELGPGSIWNWLLSTCRIIPPEERICLDTTKASPPVPKNIIEDFIFIPQQRWF